MSDHTDEIKVPSLTAIKKLLDPIYMRFDQIEESFKAFRKETTPKFYRNEDLKKIFGLSNNTIVKYRDTGILPYTKLGDIYLYDSKKINQILKENEA